MRKKAYFTLLVVLAAWCMLLTSAALQGQEKMPVTTASMEAEEQFNHGMKKFEAFHFPQAISHFKKAVELDPDFAMAYLYLSSAKGSGWFDTKYLDKAVSLADKVSKAEKHMIHYARAMVDNDHKAIEKHRNILADMYPQDEIVHQWVSMSYYMNEEYPQAIKHLTLATEINPDFHPAYNMLGYCYMAEGDMKQAEKAFKTYMEILPDNANPHDSYAEFLLRNGRFSESINHYNKALEISPDYMASHKGLADNYLFLGNFMKARKHYQAYSNNNSNSDVQFSGLLYEASVDLHENNPESAIRMMDKYIQRAEEMNMPYYQILGESYKGYILTESGKPEEGIKHYRKAMEQIETADLPVTMKENLNTQAQLWEFYALTSNGDMEKAEEARMKCKETLRMTDNPNHWKTYYQIYGIMQLHKGLYEQARQNLARAWNTPRTWYYTGVTWDKEGNRSKARQWYQKVAYHYQNSIELGGVRNKAMAGLEE